VIAIVTVTGEARRNEKPPRLVFAVERGAVVAPDDGVLYAADFGGDVDVYRTRRREAPANALAWASLEEDQSVGDLAPAIRGLPYAAEASWRMSLAEAERAGSMRISSRGLVCGVRRASSQDGRWEGFIGEGFDTLPVVTLEDRIAAMAVAIAARGNSWWGQYEQILRARRGNLTWGEPVFAPTDVIPLPPISH
jgi:hypothetical protein